MLHLFGRIKTQNSIILLTDWLKKNLDDASHRVNLLNLPITIGPVRFFNLVAIASQLDAVKY